MGGVGAGQRVSVDTGPTLHTSAYSHTAILPSLPYRHPRHTAIPSYTFQSSHTSPTFHTSHTSYTSNTTKTSHTTKTLHTSHILQPCRTCYSSHAPYICNICD